MTTYHSDYEQAAKKIIAEVGEEIVIGVPLGLGKPLGLLNALYRLAEQHRSLKLTIVTALTLTKPSLKNELEKRLLEPILDRVFQDYEDPCYEKARRLQQLPANIRVLEFFLSPGEYLHNAYVQQHYISSNYSDAVKNTQAYGINVLAQQVAQSPQYPQTYSLSCNSDLFQLMAQQLAKADKKIAIVAELNLKLPFMPNEEALVQEEKFTDIIDSGHYRTLFSLPCEALSTQDHLIGLYASCLIKDDSCLQMGIGKLNTAVTNALIMRHQQSASYQAVLQELELAKKFDKRLLELGAEEDFKKGLYASTEMLGDDYIQLYKAGILKKKVYDHLGLQSLLNSQTITEEISPQTIDVLLKHKLIQEKLSAEDFCFLQKFGIFKSGLSYEQGWLLLAPGKKILADLSSAPAKQKIMESCLGDFLKSGKLLHACFFLGSAAFYQQLRDLEPSELERFSMTSVFRTNTLYWSYDLACSQRQNARFINFAMMLSLGGEAVSDGLRNYQEVSGVGGQFDFVHMAFSLPGARSIIACRSVRETQRGLESNIVWDYPSPTIARYYRDLVVTEYGLADCRGKTDAEVIKALLNISDSRFQKQLLASAKRYRKLEQSYEIPLHFQQNYPERLESLIARWQKTGYFKPYPFGSDLSAEEQVLASALLYLKKCSRLKLILLSLAALLFFKGDARFYSYLQRMKLEHPQNLKEFFYKKLLVLPEFLWVQR